MQENRKSKGCFQCPRLSLAASSGRFISSMGFSIFIDCFFRLFPISALRSLPISLSSITMLSSSSFFQELQAESELTREARRAFKCLRWARLFDGHSNDNAYLVLSWYLWYSYLQMETIFLVQWNREMVSFSQFSTEINQTWHARDPTQGLLYTTLKPDLNLKTASLEAIFMKNRALKKWVWIQGRLEFEDHLLCIGSLDIKPSDDLIGYLEI